MKLTKQCKLFYREGNSDKVYEIDLCELTATEYIVNFRYGRRGTALKEGTKTPASVSLESADKLFNQIENEKRSKGYQTEEEVNLVLPTLDTLHLDARSNAVVVRLQDAVNGVNSFKTDWKISRVIWKVGLLKINEALPFVLKLAQKGDEFEIYASIFAFIQLKAQETLPFIKTKALQLKQKEYIRWISFEAYFQICSDISKKEELVQDVLKHLSSECLQIWNDKNYNALYLFWGKQLEEGKSFKDLVVLYLLSSLYPEWNSIVQQIVLELPFRAPYFKTLRSIYKLAQLRNDIEVVSSLVYQFEKQDPMFLRTVSLNQDSEKVRQFIPALSEVLNVGKELKKENSKIAFSQYTKYYFQKNSIRFLNQLGEQSNAELFVNFAVAFLLQYRKADFTSAYTHSQYYGKYNYELKKYFYSTIEYSDCSKSYLLNKIIDGNNPKRQFAKNLESFLNVKVEISDKWYYEAQSVRPYVENPKNKKNTSKPAEIIDKGSQGILGFFRNLFGKKTEEIKVVPSVSEEIHPQMEPSIAEIQVANQRFELFPELWDLFPKSYLELLKKAQLEFIHEFAENRFLNHPEFNSISSTLTSHEILELMANPFAIPQRLGFDFFKNKQNEFVQNVTLFFDLLATPHKEGLSWACTVLELNPNFYLSKVDYVVQLLCNNQKYLDVWMNNFFKTNSVNPDLIKDVIEVTLVKMVALEDSIANNELAKNYIIRLKAIGADELVHLNNEIIQMLLNSVLEMNALLVAEIIKLKVGKGLNVSFELIVSLIGNNRLEISSLGLEILGKISNETLQENWLKLLPLLQSTNSKTIKAILVLGAKDFLSNQIVSTWVSIVQVLVKTPSFEQSHKIILDNLSYYEKNLEYLEPNYLIQALFSKYSVVQLKASYWLKHYTRKHEFTMKQIVSIADNDCIEARVWAFDYFENHIEKVKKDKDQALILVHSKWDDTRKFAFQFFKSNFDEYNWDTLTLISLIDSIRPDVIQFGKELMMKYFVDTQGQEYLLALAQHPTEAIQLYVSNLLKEYASDSVEKLKELDYYFKSVLLKVNKGRITKNRIIAFLSTEAMKNEESASYVNQLFSFMVASSAKQDKSKYIITLSKIQDNYPSLGSCLISN